MKKLKYNEFKHLTKVTYVKTDLDCFGTTLSLSGVKALPQKMSLKLKTDAQV